MRYQFNSAEFLSKISDGDFSDMSCEKLEIFEKILPK
jgi:hypothetical protein